VILTWCFPLGKRFIDITSLGEARHRPKESNPGPKFAIVAGDSIKARSFMGTAQLDSSDAMPGY
jgi:hypothetical protein